MHDALQRFHFGPDAEWSDYTPSLVSSMLPDGWMRFASTPLKFLTRLYTLAFTTFEKSILGFSRHWNEWSQLFASLRTSLTPSVNVFLPSDAGRVVTVALWRIRIAYYFSETVFPRSRRSAMNGEDMEETEDGKNLSYDAVLFGDTHLDLLTAAIRYNRFDDDFFLSASDGVVLTAVYPLPHRVVCAEELPDLSRFLLLADFAIDPQRQKKHGTLNQEGTHLFLCKMLNQICHIRHLCSVIKKLMALYPEIAALLRLVLRVSLLGNYPYHVAYRMAYASRIRVNMEFADNPLRRESTISPIEEHSGQKRLMRWLMKHRHTVMFLMRENFLYTCERDYVIDKSLIEQGIKWNDFKVIARLATVQIRRILDTQIRVDFWARIRWNVIEVSTRKLKEPPVASMAQAFKEGPVWLLELIRRRIRWKRRKARVRSGELHRIKAMHSLSLGTSQKILKGRVETVLPKKMIPVTPMLLAHHIDAYIEKDVKWRDLRRTLEAGGGGDGVDIDFIRNRAFPLTPVDALRDHVCKNYIVPPVREVLHRATEVLYLCAWGAAQQTMNTNGSDREQQVIPLRWLQLLPITRAQAEIVRRWVYDYYVHGLSDDSYKHLAFLLGKESLVAHLIVFHFFRMTHAFRKTDVFLLPVSHALRQINILRERYGILPHQATPDELGKALYCTGCNRWASAVQTSPVWVEERYDRATIEARVLDIQNDEKEKTGVARLLLPSDFVRPSIPLGSASLTFNIPDGERYCSNGKSSVVKRLEQIKSGFGTWVTTEEERLAQLEMSRPVPAAAVPIEIAPDDDGDADARKKKDSKKKRKKKNKKKQQKTMKKETDYTVAAFEEMSTAISVNPFDAPATCDSHALMTIDLVGIWYITAKEVIGLCVFCGSPTSVRTEKITNYGLSCMNHPHIEYALDHVHTHAFDRAPNTLAPGQLNNPIFDSHARALRKHPLVLDNLVNCRYCEQYKTRSVIRVFDAAFRLYDVPLCKLEMGALRSQLPTMQLGKPGAHIRAVEPIYVQTLVRELDRASGVRSRQQRKKEKAKLGGGGDNEHTDTPMSSVSDAVVVVSPPPPPQLPQPRRHKVYTMDDIRTRIKEDAGFLPRFDALMKANQKLAEEYGLFCATPGAPKDRTQQTFRTIFELLS